MKLLPAILEVGIHMKFLSLWNFVFLLTFEMNSWYAGFLCADLRDFLFLFFFFGPKKKVCRVKFLDWQLRKEGQRKGV